VHFHFKCHLYFDTKAFLALQEIMQFKKYVKMFFVKLMKLDFFKNRNI